ncbi:MAG: Zn-dependent hydrolase [Actinobacteria bacterium]|nr:Zn-dependent hydrolase [Actinomycetota bacterium]
MKIDRSRSTARIEADVELLGTAPYTDSATAICRYAYTPTYARTLAFFEERLGELGFTVELDPVGNLLARNRPPGEPVFGIGSHCDSNRNGGKYDGTLGVVTALEICRLNAELGLDLPLQVISFLEEEGSGFGQVLLGSRIMAGTIGAEELAAVTALDDGRSWFDHAREAGRDPDHWRDCGRALADLSGWIEVHIEQGRVLQDTGKRIGIVSAIAGYAHGDITFAGRADHAGATPMDFRADALAAAAEVVLAVERLAAAAGSGTVGTVGELEVDPGLINVVPGRARASLDVRGVDDSLVRRVVDGAVEVARDAGARRGVEVTCAERTSISATPMDATILAALRRAAEETGEPFTDLPSGAAHDTMSVAVHRPTAMVFVPCLDGISHSPAERSDPADAALAAELTLSAIAELVALR